MLRRPATTHKCLSTAPTTSFVTKGEKQAHNGSYIFVNQCYVQRIAPQMAHFNEHENNVRPVLMVHGGGFSGAMWEVTPDRRPGWAIQASMPPFRRTVFLLDHVDYGRSQAAPSYLRQGEIENRTAFQDWTLFRLGSAEGFKSLKLFRGSKFPLASFDAMVASQVTRRWTTDDVEVGGLLDALHEIGPCDIVAHSHGVQVILAALDRDESARKLVSRMALVEPGKTAQVPENNLKMPPTLIVWGDYLSGDEFWEDVVLRMEGMAAEKRHLPHAGITGNTHCPMFDSNSDEVGNMIFEWLGQDDICED